MVIDEKDTSWARNLALALRAWCDSNDYFPRNKLRDELGLTDVQWSIIAAGSRNTAVSDISAYARIYRRTGLDLADPRKIPPRTRHVPPDRSILEPRGWSEEEYQKWLANPVIPERATVKSAAKQKETVVKVQPSKPPPRASLRDDADKIPIGALSTTKHQTAGSILEELISKIGHDIGREILDNVRVGLRDESILSSEKEEGEGSEKDASKGRVQAAFRMLNKEIAKIRDGQIADRDNFVTSYREEIGQLYAHLRVLAQEPEQREQSLQMKESTRHLDRR